MDSADAWWLSLTNERREQVHQWVDKRSHAAAHPEVPGQDPLPLFDPDHPEKDTPTDE